MVENIADWLTKRPVRKPPIREERRPLLPR
jgi:hypothetical protein